MTETLFALGSIGIAAFCTAAGFLIGGLITKLKVEGYTGVWK